ncbi:MAG: hypothetical protein M0P31_04020 [Solirubrobacteraceae bacterium]|nr:hypothetical protein [Solirubrobacteraceae bacterium]
MPAERDSLRFYVDESALGIGRTLVAARKDVIHVGHDLSKHVCPPGVPDTVWIPEIARRGLVVIARDQKIRSRPAELLALREAGLRVFWIAGKRDMNTWEWLTRLVRNWDEIERIVSRRPEGPWFYAINERTVTEIRLPS